MSRVSDTHTSLKTSVVAILLPRTEGVRISSSGSEDLELCKAKNWTADEETTEPYQTKFGLGLEAEMDETLTKTPLRWAAKMGWAAAALW